MRREPRFTQETLDAVLVKVCAQAGLDPAGARLLRFTNNAIYLLESAPVVVRIVGSHALRHRTTKVVDVADHLAAHGVPATRLYPVVQPVVVGAHAATLWYRVDETSRPPRAKQLAALLRALHALPLPPGVGSWSPLDDVRARVADAEELAGADRRFLLDRCAEVADQLAALEFASPPVLLHGDAHLGNVLVTADGPVLCDFDSAGIGPREWDLVPVAVGVLRFAEPLAVYRELAESYGVDVLDSPVFPALQAARELKLTTSVLPSLRSNPELRPELRRRLDDLRAGRVDVRWQRYA